MGIDCFSFEALKREIETSIHARELHAHSSYIYKHPTVQRAWAVRYNLRTSFSGQMCSGFSFNRGKNTKAISLQNGKNTFCDLLKERLSAVLL